MTMKHLLITSIAILTLLCAMSVFGDRSQDAMSKVTIAVQGMMKSKSGAT